MASPKTLVTVPVTVNPAAANGKLCSPDPAQAPANRPPTQFIFTLPNSGNWEWVGPSPVVVNTPSNQFPGASHHHPTDGTVLLDDVNSESGWYQYTVTIVHKKTKQQVQIDPFIQNQ